MHAAVLHEFGSAPRYDQFEDPVARDGEALVKVLAASLKQIDKGMASGKHYASHRELPVVCGVDGVGRLETGERVLFGGCRKPFGAIAEKTVAPRAFCFPLPDGVDDAMAAALPNPALSSWLPLKYRAKLQPGETVLVLGATGTAGKLAVQIAKLLGAGRVIAAGRNPKQLEGRNRWAPTLPFVLTSRERIWRKLLRRLPGMESISCSIIFGARRRKL